MGILKYYLDISKTIVVSLSCGLMHKIVTQRVNVLHNRLWQPSCFKRGHGSEKVIMIVPFSFFSHLYIIL